MDKQLTDLLTKIKTSQPGLLTFIAALIFILTALIEYIACFQQEDIDTAKISMTGPLDSLGRFCELFLKIIGKANAVQLLAPLIAGLLAEEGRVNSNHENVTKPKYLAVLEEISQLLK